MHHRDIDRSGWTRPFRCPGRQLRRRSTPASGAGACGQPVLFLRNPRVPKVVPKSSTACARRRPHFWPSAPSPHVLCSVRAGTETTTQPAAHVVLSLQPTAEGVLPGQLLERAIRAGYIDAGRFKIPDANMQPASLDLRLGERALRIRCSFLPGADSVERKLKDYILDEIDLRGDGAMLEARCPYLIELKERLDLPAGLRGKANPKSSTGRIDVFTRVITDHSDRFDEVAAGLPRPPLPRGGAAVVRRPGARGPDAQPAAPLHGPALAHRRRGAPGPPRASRSSSRDGEPVPVDDLVLSDGLFLGLDLHGDERGPGGLQHPRQRAAARPHAGGEVDPAPFWDPVFREDGDRLVLSPEALLPADVPRGGEHPAGPGGRDDGVRPDERRAADALRRLLRSRVRLRPRPAASAAPGPRSRCGRTTCPSWSRTGRRSAS